MDKNKSLVSKEPELGKIIKRERASLFKKEEELFRLVEDYVYVKSSIKNFYLKVYLPELGPCIEELENLKDRLLGIKKTEDPKAFLEEEEEKKELPPEIKRELKMLYRKLARLYHPDNTAGLGREEKKFFNRRMSEINEAFEKQNLDSLKRFFKKAEAEIGFNMSSLERIKYLETDSQIVSKMQELYLARIQKLKANEIYLLMGKPEKEREQTMRELRERFVSDIKTYRSLLAKMRE